MGWLYSWDAYPATGQPDADPFVPDGLRFFPMLWGASGDRLADWHQYVLGDRDAPRNAARVAMGPNEVNQPGQADMSPADACALFRQHIMPLKYDSGWAVIGASTNGAPHGFHWMDRFKAHCPDVWDNIDADAIHMYEYDPHKAIAYAHKWHDTYGKPVFITEAACVDFAGGRTPDQGQAYYFVTTLAQFARDTDWVHGLAFYGTMRHLNIDAVDRMVGDDGDPTGLFWSWVNHSS